MANPAAVSDVVARFRPLSDGEEGLAQELLDDAWAIVTGRLPLLEQCLDEGIISLRNAQRVLATMVVRVLRNPEGLLEESIDDYRKRRDALVSTGVLYVSDGELSDLTPASARRRSGSVRLVAHGES